MGEIYTENAALGIVLKYGVVHRVEKEQKAIAKMEEERIKSREAKQAKKTEDGVKTVQVLAEKVNQAEVQAQKSAETGVMAVEFAKMAMGCGQSKPNWMGSFTSYGIKKFTGVLECEMPFEKWGKLIMAIYNQVVASDAQMNMEILKMIDHPGVNIEGETVIECTVPTMLDIIERQICEFHGQNFNISITREKDQLCCDYLKELRALVRRLQVEVTDDWFKNHLRAQSKYGYDPRIDGMTVDEAFGFVDAEEWKRILFEPGYCHLHIK